ncbi:EAL domain-containing protein [Marinomonas sp. M1K-6]|uniref:EAL domain-containing protein n=1 Tax=Marinomonas profundi TaxID=2726122 RepID=A0A847R8B6_9GAMM|nr:EAL domain-containing protein [Marinomonas profundi]NLQ18723.1 EAL domain-containing protein [Marinomonas profundi]UDV04031.1 EAL domain-containing protein [Marinomonas profundi]
MLNIARLSDDKVDTHYRGLSLSSHFQPIFSIAHGRAVGYEGLIRAHRPDGTAEPPAGLLSIPCNGRECLDLDRTCRTLHVHNFARQATGEAWLFLNLNSQYLVSEQPDIGFTRDLLQTSGIAAHRLVIEIIESEVSDHAQLKHFVSHFRQLGCLIAIDDFGAGHSNFDRIWDLEPDIVKIDRRLIQDAGQSRRVERILTGIVSLLHEAGSLVVVEGVETEHEALVAIAANADMIQGFYFAKPQARIDAEQSFATTFDNLLRGQQWQSVKRNADLQHYVSGIEGLFHRAVTHFVTHQHFEQSSAVLFSDPRMVRCYLLNAEGYQVSRNVYAPHYQQQMNARFAPLLCGDHANWSHKHYHYRALKQPGIIQISRPYLSVADSRMCITVSQTVVVGGTLYVFCCDLNWQEP